MAFGGRIKKLFQGLTRTRENLSTSIQTFVGAVREVDDAVLEDLEAALLAADLGPALSSEIVGRVRERARRETLDERGLQGVLRDVLRGTLEAEESGPDDTPADAASSPRVVFVVGVNGGGKTTTVGKLAARARAEDRKTMVVAADTFRAAAVEQLERWAERAGADVVKQREGADPAAVVFDALGSAKARSYDIVLVDTAGRLHTKVNLMAELQKVVRVAQKQIPEAPHEVLLVVDATTGQNGLTQAEEFTRAARLTGVVLTKLDGTAKGGVALAIRKRLGVPIRYVGVGEAVDDLLPFDAESFLEGLLGETGDG